MSAAIGSPRRSRVQAQSLRVPDPGQSKTPAQFEFLVNKTDVISQTLQSLSTEFSTDLAAERCPARTDTRSGRTFADADKIGVRLALVSGPRLRDVRPPHIDCAMALCRRESARRAAQKRRAADVDRSWGAV